MTAILTTEAISRRKALTLLGLATAAFAASSVVSAPDAEAQTAGMERRQAVSKPADVKAEARDFGPVEPTRVLGSPPVTAALGWPARH